MPQTAGYLGIGLSEAISNRQQDGQGNKLCTFWHTGAIVSAKFKHNEKLLVDSSQKPFILFKLFCEHSFNL